MPKRCPHFLRPPWRTIYGGVGLLAAFWIVWSLWSPGVEVTDGRNDQGKNGIWLQHGWLADDDWFERQGDRLDRATFRTSKRVEELARQLEAQGIGYVYPHVCPCDPDGTIASTDAQQIEHFLDGVSEEIVVLPWIGGVHKVSAAPSDENCGRILSRALCLC